MEVRSAARRRRHLPKLTTVAPEYKDPRIKTQNHRKSLRFLLDLHEFIESSPLCEFLPEGGFKITSQAAFRNLFKVMQNRQTIRVSQVPQLCAGLYSSFVNKLRIYRFSPNDPNFVNSHFKSTCQDLVQIVVDKEHPNAVEDSEDDDAMDVDAAFADLNPFQDQDSDEGNIAKPSLQCLGDLQQSLEQCCAPYTFHDKMLQQELLKMRHTIHALQVDAPVCLTVPLRWVSKLLHSVLDESIGMFSPKLDFRRAVVEFATPSIGYPMAAVHLRSAIVGDSLSRMFEFGGAEVLRSCHIKDWIPEMGSYTQLMLEYEPQWETLNETELNELFLDSGLAQASQQKCGDDPGFNARAKNAQKLLEVGEERHTKAWVATYSFFAREYREMYDRFGIHPILMFSSNFMLEMLDLLKGLVASGSIIRVKQDYYSKNLDNIKTLEAFGESYIEEGGCCVSVTDIAGKPCLAAHELGALWYYINRFESDRTIYIKDKSFTFDYDFFTEAASVARWLEFGKKESHHVVLGSVTLGHKLDGLSRSLDQIKDQAKSVLENLGLVRKPTKEDIERLVNGGVKYAFLKSVEEQSFDDSLSSIFDPEGNTVVSLQCAYTLVHSAVEGRDVVVMKDTGHILPEMEVQCHLAHHLFQFSEIIEECLELMKPSIMCKYLGALTKYLSDFFNFCERTCTLESPTNILLSEVSRIVLLKSLDLLGIDVVLLQRR